MQIDAPYATAAETRREAVAVLRPLSTVTVSQTAERYRILDNPGGGFSGPWRNRIAPYLVDVMDSLTAALYHTTVFVAPAQCGKSEVGLNWALYSVVEDPADFLAIQGDKSMAEDFSVRRRDKMIRSCPALSDQLQRKNLLTATFPGVLMTISWPSGPQAASRPLPRVWLDERDDMADDLDGQGDPAAMFGKRVQTFGPSGHVFVASSPKKAVIPGKTKPASPHEAPPATGILALYNRGTRKRWYWQCPQCQDWFIPAFECLTWEEGATAESEHIGVVMVCPACGMPIAADQKAALNAGGRWLAHGQNLDAEGRISGKPPVTGIDSYWLQGCEAAFISWEDLVRRYLSAQAELEKTGSDTTLKTWTNVDLGRPYEPAVAVGEGLDAAVLQARAEGYPLRVVPEGVRYLVSTVDVQGSYFDVMVRGFGVDDESWIIDKFQIGASGARVLDPAAYIEDWDLLAEQVIRASYPLAGRPDWRMTVMTTVIDTGGAPGVSAKAYEFWRTQRSQGLPDQRITLVKGEGIGRNLDVAETKVDTAKSGRRAGSVKLFLLNVDRLKDLTHARLRRSAPGPGYVHFSGELVQDARPGAVAEFFEQIAAEHKVDGRWTKLRPRNEVWDLMIYGEAGRIRLRGQAINWADPPLWAAPWDRNSMIVRADLPELSAPMRVPSPEAVKPVNVAIRSSYIDGGRS